jgi:hypothetical protein
MRSDTYVFKTSRLEIANAITESFRGSLLSREQLLAAAKEAHASTEVLLALSCLREDRQYVQLRQLWPDLPDLPVEPE